MLIASKVDFFLLYFKTDLIPIVFNRTVSQEKNLFLAAYQRARGKDNEQNLVQGEAISILSCKKHKKQEKLYIYIYIYIYIDKQKLHIYKAVVHPDILMKFKVPDFVNK